MSMEQTMGDFRMGDRVRVVRTIQGYYPEQGWVGECLDKATADANYGPCVTVKWGAVPHYLCRDSATRVPVCMLELHSPAAVPTAEQQPPGDWVSRKEHAALKGELARIKTAMWPELGKAGDLGEDYVYLAQRIVCELGDTRGENDTLRARVARLEAALDLAQQKRGKR